MTKKGFTATAAALALAAAAAFTIPAGGASAGPSAAPAGGPGMHGRDMGDRLARLKSQLEITSSQEKAWDSFASALTAMHSGKPPMKAAAAGTTGLVPAPQVFASLAQHAQTMADNAKKLSNSAASLYKALTPTQRAVLDKHLADMHAAMGHHPGDWKNRGKGPNPPTPMEDGSGGGN